MPYMYYLVLDKKNEVKERITIFNLAKKLGIRNISNCKEIDEKLKTYNMKVSVENRYDYIIEDFDGYEYKCGKSRERKRVGLFENDCLVKEFENMVEAAKYIGTSPQTVARIVNKQIKRAKHVDLRLI